MFTQAWTVHQAIPWAAATSPTARPEQITASSTATRNRVVALARNGTCSVDSANLSLLTVWPPSRSNLADLR